MIVRVSTEAQYRLDDGQADRLNELDNQAVAAVDSGDEAAWADLWGQMLEIARGGERLDGEDDITVSEVILPPPDLTFEEAGEEFTGEGLIPG